MTSEAWAGVGEKGRQVGSGEGQTQAGALAGSGSTFREGLPTWACWKPSPRPGRGLTDESEILRFLQHGTLVGLLPVPHPILIRKYQANSGTAMWFRTYMWGVIYLRWVRRWGAGVGLGLGLGSGSHHGSSLKVKTVNRGGGGGLVKLRVGSPCLGWEGVGAVLPPSCSPVSAARPPGTPATACSLRRNVDPPVWYDTDVKLFDIQRV